MWFLPKTDRSIKSMCAAPTDMLERTYLRRLVGKMAASRQPDKARAVRYVLVSARARGGKRYITKNIGLGRLSSRLGLPATSTVDQGDGWCGVGIFLS